MINLNIGIRAILLSHKNKTPPHPSSQQLGGGVCCIENGDVICFDQWLSAEGRVQHEKIELDIIPKSIHQLKI